jgi:large subunit ribosomal protein L23
MAKKATTTKEGEAKIAEKKVFIIAPRVTEKASLQSEVNAYTFVVEKNATKLTLASQIKKTYGVTPRAITIVNVKGTKKFSCGRWGMTPFMKKAVVFLKKGDTIKLA